MTDDERAKLDHYLGVGFRDLNLADIHRANECDVRMGTFTLCVAFLDALSLVYSAGRKVKGGKAGKWERFLRNYLREPYRDLWDSYGNFRSKLLHNYGATGIAFTHGPDTKHLHLTKTSRGEVYLHRESFVADVEAAFAAFYADVEHDEELRARVLKFLEGRPPMGLAPFD